MLRISLPLTAWLLLFLTSNPLTASFRFVENGQAVPIVISPDSPGPIHRAARDLASDIERVTGHAPDLLDRLPTSHQPYILIGLHDDPLISQRLSTAQSIDTSSLAGEWESYSIAESESTSHPTPDLLIIGSDVRGAIFGIYEVSRRIGVSPWYWWADVPVIANPEVTLDASTPITGSPSVKYRGIFINDEDWGLQPWASHTHDPELGDIGPKTYARIFELLLRLKANLLWPAMHEVTRAFNANADNARIASEYGIIMGSSHAEPMLRNNVREWSLPKEHYNFSTHPQEVLSYWDKRIAANKDYENIYTLGMRGIHDSGMTAGNSIEEKVAFLDTILRGQRSILSRHLGNDLSRIPQVFTPYKEVLELYDNGLTIPDEVTLVWPDDNHGYIRHFPTPAEQQRAGGSGIYYHLSYLGAPLSYLWLQTTPPGVIWQQMHQAWANGARTLWVANVGDIKPAECATGFFLELAWDIHRWQPETVGAFIQDWSKHAFGSRYAEEIASIIQGYYELNFQRRPEQLQWWMPHTRETASPLTLREKEERLAAFANLTQRAQAVEAALSTVFRDAFFQLVLYPVAASDAANQRVFHNERYRELFFDDNALRRQHGLMVLQADKRLHELTHHYNHGVSNGKWRHMMAVEPADYNWRSYRTAAIPIPAENMVAEKWNPTLLPHPAEDIGALLPQDLPEEDHYFTEIDGVIAIEAEHFTLRTSPADALWRVVAGAGRSGDAVTIFPENSPTLDPEDAVAATLEYAFTTQSSGPVQLTAWLLPTFPADNSGILRLAISLDDDDPTIIEIPREVGDDTWKQAVLNATVTATTALGSLKTGDHVLRLIQLDPGVVVDKLALHFEPLPTTYLGPKETRVRK